MHAGSATEQSSRHIRDAAVDAWIVLTAPMPTRRRRGLVRRRPIVVLNQPALDRIALVRIDDHGGTQIAAQHLLSLGHRRFRVLVDDAGSPTAGTAVLTNLDKTRRATA